jgi:hypothetical protein
MISLNSFVAAERGREKSSLASAPPLLFWSISEKRWAALFALTPEYCRIRNTYTTVVESKKDALGSGGVRTCV